MFKIEGERPKDTERAAPADLIEQAAKRIDAEVLWYGAKNNRSSLRNCATVTFEGEEVLVEAVSAKLGALITDPYGQRMAYYTDAKKLAESIKRRARGSKARDEKYERDRKEKNAREEAEAVRRREAETELILMFGYPLVEACVSINAHVMPPYEVPYRIDLRINVYCGKIDGSNLNFAEAVRFIQLLIGGGYMIAEQEKMFPSPPAEKLAPAVAETPANALHKEMVKCCGENCPNGGVTSLASDDTLVIGDKAYCSACRTDAEYKEACAHASDSEES